MGDQIDPGDQNAVLIWSPRSDLVTNLVTQERSGRPEAMWSAGHLVVDLVVVDAFSSSTFLGPTV